VADVDDMHGFEERDGALPRPPVGVEDATRERLIRVVAAIVTGSTPEEVAAYLDRGFPDRVDELLAQPLQHDEFSDHVDLLLTAMQSPAPAAA
jgi:alkanesulfonate monooxygenase SsuD/methylene tetrahydromethanopterin reductase-like flavin-dependent oxidoreductase (luciferase family)